MLQRCSYNKMGTCRNALLQYDFTAPAKTQKCRPRSKWNSCVFWVWPHGQNVKALSPSGMLIRQPGFWHVEGGTGSLQRMPGASGLGLRTASLGLGRQRCQGNRPFAPSQGLPHQTEPSTQDRESGPHIPHVKHASQGTAHQIISETWHWAVRCFPDWPRQPPAALLA